MTRIALQKSAGRFLVGYTDCMEPGRAADWPTPQRLCFDWSDCPENVHERRLANENFLAVFDHYDAVLKATEISVTWMASPREMHVPSYQFTNMVSPEIFGEFYPPSLLAEVTHMADKFSTSTAKASFGTSTAPGGSRKSTRSNGCRASATTCRSWNGFP